jgi:Lrp/AsnC family leucine-responsive transcriptional regulator
LDCLGANARAQVCIKRRTLEQVSHSRRFVGIFEIVDPIPHSVPAQTCLHAYDLTPNYDGGDKRCFDNRDAIHNFYDIRYSMTEDYSLDDADRRLIEVLQRDGRITNQELARQCGLSPAACHERVRRLRERQVIKSYVAIIEPKALGCGMLFFVEVVLDRTTNDAFHAFAEHVSSIPEILECHMVAGGFDYLLKARVSDMAEYREFLGSTLASAPGVRETRTYPVLEQVKETTRLRVPVSRHA